MDIQTTGVPTKGLRDTLTHNEFNALNIAVNLLAAEAVTAGDNPSHRLLAGLSTGSLYVINLNAG